MSPILTKSGQRPTFQELRKEAAVVLGEEVTDKEGQYGEGSVTSGSPTSVKRHIKRQNSGDVGWRNRPDTTPRTSSAGSFTDDDLIYAGSIHAQSISRRSSLHTSPRLPLSYARRDYEDESDAEQDEAETRRLPNGPSSKWVDLRNLLMAATPSLLLGLIGLVFTGELLEHLARWRVFRSVDELFILVPVIGNLKGNLEMCLSARLGTSANIGELDTKRTRHALLFANLSLLQLQALVISAIAAFLSFLLGLLTTHRIGDAPPPSGTSSIIQNATLAGVPYSGIPIGDVDYQEGYTRPGFNQLMMVLATGMGAASLSSAVLGSFMGSLIVGCRWVGVDPDNITAPLAACLGDLLTLFILALLGTMLVGAMDTPIPLVAVILLFIAAGWFTHRVMKDRWVKTVARGGWGPLIAAMFISSCTGMVLERSVGRYKGYSLLAVSMTGLTGSIGAIHASRLSTLLHTALTNPTAVPKNCLTPKQAALALFLVAFPVQACFVAFVEAAGWVTVDLGIWCWAAYTVTAVISIGTAHWMTNFFWSKELDPDSYTLPLHSSFIDLIGQILLVAAFEGARIAGRDVMVDGWDF